LARFPSAILRVERFDALIGSQTRLAAIIPVTETATLKTMGEAGFDIFGKGFDDNQNRHVASST
jgi:hypothetical protein